MMGIQGQRKSRWHVALMEPRAARLAQDAEGKWGSTPERVLRARGYEVYYPAFPKAQKRYGLIELKMYALFPGYIFVTAAPHGWEALRMTPGMHTFSPLL